jgi:hypothetical protein
MPRLVSLFLWNLSDGRWGGVGLCHPISRLQRAHSGKIGPRLNRYEGRVYNLSERVRVPKSMMA